MPDLIYFFSQEHVHALNAMDNFFLYGPYNFMNKGVEGLGDN
jgi:hypothetical protein